MVRLQITLQDLLLIASEKYKIPVNMIDVLNEDDIVGEDVRALIADGKKFQAIVLVRERLNYTLLKAKEYIESLDLTK